MRTKGILSKNVKKKKKKNCLLEILISFRPNPENLIRVQEAVAVTKEK